MESPDVLGTPTLVNEKRSLQGVSQLGVRGSGSREVGSPKESLGSDAQILQDKPDTVLLVVINQTGRAGHEAADKIPSVHARVLLGGQMGSTLGTEILGVATGVSIVLLRWQMAGASQIGAGAAGEAIRC